jgi:hypothetical protein
MQHSLGTSRKTALEAALEACRAAVRNHCIISNTGGAVGISVEIAVPAPTAAVQAEDIKKAFPKFTTVEVSAHAFLPVQL